MTQRRRDIALLGLGFIVTFAPNLALTREPEPTGPNDLRTIMIEKTQYNMMVFHDSNVGVRWFNEELINRGIPWKIEYCSDLVNVPVGVVHGNRSYGAYCEVTDGERRSFVEICNDVLVGHFTFRMLDKRKSNPEELATFIAANCYGG